MRFVVFCCSVVGFVSLFMLWGLGAPTPPWACLWPICSVLAYLREVP